MTGHKLSDTKQASTRKLINIMRRLARDLPCKDNVTNTAITEAADRLEELQIESDMHSMGFRKVRDNEVKHHRGDVQRPRVGHWQNRRKQMTQNRYPETTNPEQCILVIGNPVDGLRFVGRFDTPTDASDYGDQAFGDQTWWVAPLECVQCDEEGNWVNPEIGDDPDDMPHGPKCAMRFCNAAECTCAKSELVHKLSSDEIIDMQKHTPVFITNGCCEATHDSLPEVFAKLGLQHGEFDGEWYPLTKEESQYISDDEIVAAGTCVRTGYACLYQGKKWLYPIMLTEDNSAIPPKLQSAMADMGGEVHVDEEGFGLRIPFEWAMKWCPNYDAYKTSLQLILEETLDNE